MRVPGLYCNLHFQEMWGRTERTLFLMTERLKGGHLIQLQSKDRIRYVVGMKTPGE